MTKDLDVLVVSFGPVQRLVSASRKTRDLALGSRLLSDIALATAKSLRTASGVVDVVIPADSADAKASVSNKIVLIVDRVAGTTIGEHARAVADTTLKALAADVRKRLPAGVLDEQLFDSQIDRFLECFWATAPLEDPDRDFGSARTTAERMLDGRKALRDFAGYTGVAARDKASVDGRLDGVVVSGEALRKEYPAAIRENEQVDAIGLVRRLWPGHTRAPSASEICVSPWMEAMRAMPVGAAALDLVKECRTDLRKAIHRTLGDAIEIESLDEDAWPLQGPDGVRRAITKELREIGGSELVEPASKPLATYTAAVGAALATGSAAGHRPTPYYVVLAADGDRIGAAFSGLDSAREHRGASEQLARFAQTVRDRGAARDVHVAYAGGDDVLALMPLDAALPFAEEVHQSFAEVTAAFHDRPTVSVGAAIVHYSDRLSESIALAREAVAAAKTHADHSGNHFALVLSKRSGGDLRATLSFDRQPCALIRELVAAIASGALPRSLAHEVSIVATQIAHVPVDTARKELARVMLRKTTRDRLAIDAVLVEKLLKISGVDEAHNAKTFLERCADLSGLLRIALHLAEHSQPTVAAHDLVVVAGGPS